VLPTPCWASPPPLAGAPGFPNLAPYGRDPSGRTMAAFMAKQTKDDLTWDDVRHLRDIWPGKLVVKGLLAAEDAVAALNAGADGIWVSNHGGRQLESAPASIDAVAPIRAAIGPEATLVMDGGIRSGEDIAKARLMGADFVFSGRAFYYGVAAGGAAGAARVGQLLADDLRRVLMQIGCPSFAELDRRWLWQ
jgi:isopentenyl diphosphate isomerase/L-lactate dehydrogenase-like FMN-dependent dehydrogenase